MQTLNNKRILVGITGGIAAYKAAELVRRLQDQGASVRVVMTAAAQQFITPLTLQALSGNPVHTELLDPEAEAGMGHIELARWADLLIIAPASADFIARLAGGQADDLLTTICLATPAPIAIAPAMNQGMWRDRATQANLDTLRQRQLLVFGPAEGSQACGDTGPGRMLEADALVALAAQQFASGALTGKRVVISAGPTREAIDPVRYISNHSSGKMGFALAAAAAEAGASVVLVAGPVNLATPDRVQRIDVESATEMHDACLQAVQGADVFIGAAAVADYRPDQVATQKIKKSADQLTLALVRNPDIISDVAALATRPFVVGFAAETENLAAHARDKLARKKLDMIIANDVARSGIGFNSDQNAVTVLFQDDSRDIPVASKHQVARELITIIASHLK